MLLWLKYFFYEQFSSWTFDRLIAIWGRDNKGTDLGKGWVYPNPNPNHNPNPNPNPNPNRVSPEATRIPHHRVCGRGNGGWQRAFVAPDRPPPWWGPTIFYIKKKKRMVFRHISIRKEPPPPREGWRVMPRATDEAIRWSSSSFGGHPFTPIYANHQQKLRKHHPERRVWPCAAA